MSDFVTHCHPALAVACPTCGRGVGLWCRHSTGEPARTPHKARQAEADREFVEQYGGLAVIVPAASGWLIDPHGRMRD